MVYDLGEQFANGSNVSITRLKSLWKQHEVSFVIMVPCVITFVLNMAAISGDLSG